MYLNELLSYFIRAMLLTASAKSTVALFFAGLSVAVALAVWLHILSPKGMLLYTPPPDATPFYTPSALVGFCMATLFLAGVSALIVVLSSITGFLLNRRCSEVFKASAFLAVCFALLCAIAITTESLWR
jgi:hypothetical protein